MPRYSRRQFLALGSGAGLGTAALVFLGARRGGRDDRAIEAADRASTGAGEQHHHAAATATPERTPLATPATTLEPTPEPTPTPPPPRGRTDRLLMEGTRYESPAMIIHSGQPGPVVMVLGGVHGNEPGSWVAAEEIEHWEVTRGSLIVAPRVNRLSAAAMERTLDGFGDLNRLYPGSPEADQPMARMAHEIVELARRYPPAYLYDLHESWGFHNERGDNRGTAFIGQTITVRGSVEGSDEVLAVVDDVNAEITEREQLVYRDRNSPGMSWMRRGGSSLAMGDYVPGCTAVLVEMGQHDQPEARRAELHRMVVGTALRRLEMV